jgi:hypothetical protein
VIHRIDQGLRALIAWARPIDEQSARAILSPELMALFLRMRRSEQLHSLRVMNTLRRQGHTHPDLLTAALLHDSGKSRYPFNLVERSLAVILRKLFPGAFRRWSLSEPHGWRRMAVIVSMHPEWSAQDMEAAGASPCAVALARRHQTRVQGDPQTEEDRLLVLLQEADKDG